MEDNWAVLLNCGLPLSLNSGESVNSGEAAADETGDVTGEEVSETLNPKPQTLNLKF